MIIFFTGGTEINHIGSNGMLAAKADVVYLAHPQNLPESGFGIRQVVAQL